MAVTPLGNAVEFLVRFGFFDVVLPFLLVFTIVFAILEKTKVFGTEIIDGEKVSKKSINSMVAFVMALFVIVAQKIVFAIQTSIPQIVLILIVIVSFLMLVGSMSGSEEIDWTKSGWSKFLAVVIFVGIVAIFMNSVGWLQPVWDYVQGRWQDTLVTSIIFLAIIVGAIFWVTSGGKKKSKSSED
jgi:uncharacterized membrane protein